MKMCKDFAPTFVVTEELAVAPRQRTISHFLFHHGIFYQKQHDSHPPPTLLFSLSRLKTELKAAILTQLR
jgi:hypothetical protein